MNLQSIFDLILKKILGVGYDLNDIVMFIGLVIIVILIVKGGKRR